MTLDETIACKPASDSDETIAVGVLRKFVVSEMAIAFLLPAMVHYVADHRARAR